MTSVGYREDIDGLRGIAVLLVVLYHAFPSVLPGGFIGVDVFFVISGFLITSIVYGQLVSGSFSFLKFYKKRINRIFPALVFVLFVTLLIGWLILFPDEYKLLGHHVFRTTVFTQNFNLIDELGYFDVSNHYKPLLHFWSLGIEEQYYLVWPLVLVLLYRARASTLVFCAFAVLVSFFANIYFANDYKDVVYLHTLSRFWQIGCGSILAIYLFDVKRRARLQRLLGSGVFFVIGMLLIAIPATMVSVEFLYPYWVGLLPTIGTMIIIVVNVQLRYWFGLVWLGLISYPLYLWHWVVISFLYIYLGKTPSAVALVIAIVLSTLLAMLTKRYIERVRYNGSLNVTVGLVLIAVCLGYMGLLVNNYGGVPNRGHLNFAENLKVEFERTPQVDSLCESITRTTIDDERLFDYCRASGDSGRQTVAVIGDSHAHAFFPGVAEVAERRGYSSILLANSSCPPLISFQWGRSSKEIEICQTKIDQIFRFLRKNSNVKKVVLLTRGPVYMHGEVDGEFTNESVAQSLNELTYPDRQTYEAYKAGFDASLRSLTSLDHIDQIYYYLENPELDFLPKDVVSRPFDYFGVSTQSSFTSLELHNLRMDKYKKMMIDVSARFPSVTVIDVTPHMCSGNKCFVYKDGNFLYADDDHLSVFGSKYFSKKTAHILFGN